MIRNLELLSRETYWDTHEIICYYLHQEGFHEYEKLFVDFNPYRDKNVISIERHELIRRKQPFNNEEQKLFEEVLEIGRKGLPLTLNSNVRRVSSLTESLDIDVQRLPAQVPILEGPVEEIVMFNKHHILHELMAHNLMDRTEIMRCAKGIPYKPNLNMLSTSIPEKNIRSIVIETIPFFFWSDFPKMHWKIATFLKDHKSLMKSFSILNSLAPESRQIKNKFKTIIPKDKGSPPNIPSVVFRKSSDKIIGIDFCALRIVLRTIVRCYFDQRVVDTYERHIDDIARLESIYRLDECLTDHEKLFLFHEITEYTRQFVSTKLAMNSFKNLLKK